MTYLPTLVQIGDAVRLRRQRWRVIDLRLHEHCATVTLTGTGVRNLRSVRQFLAPFDDLEALARAQGPRFVSRRIWRRAWRALLTDQGSAAMLRTAVLAKIDLLPHQVEPALAVVCGMGSRVLLADDVGLGKTIQAGLVISELQERGAADRVLVLSPAGLREQWVSELGGRFRIDAEVIDARYLKQRGAVSAIGTNPWATIPVAVTSTDYVKRADVLPAVVACRWDVLVVDEAHGIVPGSDRHAAVSHLAATAAHVLLVTATPHSGDARSFSALCSLGRLDDQLLVFRRTRSDVGGLTSRRIHRVPVEPTAAERRMHVLLDRLTAAARAERACSDRKIWLTLALLHKRALSSAHSLERSARRHLANLTANTSDDPDQLALPLDETGEMDVTDEEPTLLGPILRNHRLEIRLLSDIADAAQAASMRESKLRMLERWLIRLRRRNESVIVFTEYRDTLNHVREALRLDCVCLHGGMTREERRLSIGAFTNGEKHILLATDAAGEGLNLHHHCRVVFNLELPWNPMRLEQRAGRVDRIGQRKTVHVFHLIADDTAESNLLARLKRRISTAQRDIGAPDPLETEQAITRGVLAQSEAGDESDPHDTPEGGESLAYRMLPPSPRAALECHQLARARVLLRRRSRSPLEDWAHLELPTCPLVAFPRRGNIRRLFHESLVVVLRTVLEDIAGRRIASHLTALQLHLRTPYRSWLDRSRVDALLETAQGAGERDPSLAPWWHESRRDHEAFWSNRVTRETSVAESFLVRHVRLQPGLFDRRAERALTADVSRRTHLLDEAQRRVIAAKHAGEVRAATKVVLALFC